MTRKRRYRTTGQLPNSRIEERTKAKTTRTQNRVDLTLAKARKAEMVGQKRKYLVILIALLMSIAAYFKFKIGG